MAVSTVHFSDVLTFLEDHWASAGGSQTSEDVHIVTGTVSQYDGRAADGRAGARSQRSCLVCHGPWVLVALRTAA